MQKITGATQTNRKLAQESALRRVATHRPCIDSSSKSIASIRRMIRMFEKVVVREGWEKYGCENMREGFYMKKIDCEKASENGSRMVIRLHRS